MVTPSVTGQEKVFVTFLQALCLDHSHKRFTPKFGKILFNLQYHFFLSYYKAHPGSLSPSHRKCILSCIISYHVQQNFHLISCRVQPGCLSPSHRRLIPGSCRSLYDKSRVMRDRLVIRMEWRSSQQEEVRPHQTKLQRQIQTHDSILGK